MMYAGNRMKPSGMGRVFIKAVVTDHEEHQLSIIFIKLIVI